MHSSSFTLTTPDGTEVFVNRWLPDGEVKAVVQISHGLAEHSARYARFAQRLTDHGYAVYASDHRGHGRTSSPRGSFAERDGWQTVIDDLHSVTARARHEQHGVPVFLLGHSMGSFIARGYAAQYGSELAGLVLSGTAGGAGALGKVGVLVASTQARLRGHTHTSGLMNKLSFGQYNSAFKPTRTDFDWLSRDPAEVDKYINDPDCGFVFSAGGFADLLRGLAMANDDRTVALIPKDLPIFLTSGDQDPVGAKGKGVQQAADQLKRLGVRDVTVTLWPDARHEILNELNRDEVELEILEWLDAHLETAQAPA
ncbi:alpha/beta hydrolase [Humibacillus xanthopallidus]|uniref:Alpha-beta hydrolase superfamily lysophospholipase n=1 Tax=Humibacillus xanthopallidus TaxID=412689 RepID=A0A543H8E1_9MICO|nr:alpha/beta hydrolase [Humibacillus xanthopallidus]TQM54625.1 alpha-beta hydrolase superfamily lysophospholipase [Humibacillus xanthopallidus]